MIPHGSSALVLLTGDDVGGSNPAQVLLYKWCRWLGTPASECKFHTVVAAYCATPLLCTQPFHPAHSIHFSSMPIGCCASPSCFNID